MGKTKIVYKLFRMKGGKLYPLYVNANEETPLRMWLSAKEGERTDKGKVKSRLGALAFRPGWHCSEFPAATHIGEKANPKDAKPSFRPEEQVWCECLIHDNVDWQSRADAAGKNPRDKQLGEVPVDGFYAYRTNPNMLGTWLIAGELFVKRILSDGEVAVINKKFGVSDLPRRKAV